MKFGSRAGVVMDEQKKVRKSAGLVKIPQNKRTVLYNVLLAIGLCLVIVGISFMTGKSSRASNGFVLYPVLIMAGGVILGFWGIAFAGSTVFIFLGLDLLLSGLLCLLSASGVLGFSLKRIWPLLLSVAGVSYFCSGIYKVKEIRSYVLFPSIALVLLGLALLPFSMKLTKGNLVAFVSRWWPLMVLLSGVMLVLIFLIQQGMRNDFPFMEDTPGGEGDFE